MQLIWIAMMVMMGFAATLGTLVLLRRARRAERIDRTREELQAFVERARRDAGDVVLSVRPAWRVFVRTKDGMPLEATAEDNAAAPKLAARLLARLRPCGDPPMVQWGEDGPPSSTTRAQLAAAAAAGGHEARSLRALHAHAETVAADTALEEHRRAERRASYRGLAPFVPVVSSGGSHGSSGHAA